jgi:hypothetical protein
VGFAPARRTRAGAGGQGGVAVPSGTPVSGSSVWWVTVDDRTNRVFVASNDLSAGANSGVWGTNVLANVATALRNTMRATRAAWTGSVTTFDLRSVR